MYTCNLVSTRARRRLQRLDGREIFTYRDTKSKTMWPAWVKEYECKVDKPPLHKKSLISSIQVFYSAFIDTLSVSMAAQTLIIHEKLYFLLQVCVLSSALIWFNFPALFLILFCVNMSMYASCWPPPLWGSCTQQPAGRSTGPSPPSTLCSPGPAPRSSSDASPCL